MVERGGVSGRSGDADSAAAIRRAVVALSRRLRTERPVDALSSTKVSVLGYLSRMGPSTPGEIAAAGRQRPQSLTRVLAELQTARLIHREPGTRDGRTAVLTLTDTGLAALGHDMTARDRWLSEALATLDQVEVGVLLLAAEVMERLAAAETTPAPDREPGRGLDGRPAARATEGRQTALPV